jgi:hypothetical protein
VGRGISRLRWVDLVEQMLADAWIAGEASGALQGRLRKRVLSNHAVQVRAGHPIGLMLG